ncbi:MAG: IPT/TIG domain-containing protein [bacterium]
MNSKIKNLAGSLVLSLLLVGLCSSAAWAVAATAKCASVANGGTDNFIYDSSGVGAVKLPAGKYVQIIQSDDATAGAPNSSTGVPSGDTVVVTGEIGTPTGYGAGEIAKSANITASKYIYIRAWDTWNGTGTPSGYYGTSTPANVGSGFVYSYKPVSFATTTQINAPALVSASPNSAYKGSSNLNVVITGQNTNFVNGTSVASFSGTGITVNSTTVSSSTQCTVNITIPTSASTGARNVTITTGSEIATGASLFTVNAPSLGVPSPASKYRGDTSFNISVSGTGTHFINGTTTASFGTGITVNSVTVTSATAATVNITMISTSAATGARDFSMITNLGALGTETVTKTGGFTVNAPSLSAPSPASGNQSWTGNVAVSGTGTHFINGTTTASFGTGITVNSVTVTSATAATVNVTIADDAAEGARNVVMTTNLGAPGTETVTRTGGFTVNAASVPTVSTVAPEAGPAGTAPWTTYVNITGTNFGSSQGTSKVYFDTTDAGTAEIWTATRIVIAVPAALSAGTSDIKVTVSGQDSNTYAFTVRTGQMIDNAESTAMYDYYDSGAGVDEANIPVPSLTTEAYYEGQKSIKIQYPGATGTQWGGFLAAGIKSPVTDLDLSSANMLIYRVKGDGTANTIRLDLAEYTMTAGDTTESFSSLDKFSLSDNSGFKEFKVPLSRIWRDKYSQFKGDNTFSGKIKGYTFVYGGTASTAQYHYVDVVSAVSWSGPIVDIIGPNFGQAGTVITIEGSGFGSTGTIAFNGTAATATSWNDTRIVVPVPAGAASGPVIVTVSSQTSNGVYFEVTSDVGPTITSLSSTLGPSGTLVTIEGSGFGSDPGAIDRSTAAEHVTFGTTRVSTSEITSWNNTAITVKVPTLADGTYEVQVRAGDKESNLKSFIVAPLPASLVSADPSSGYQGDTNLSVVITGQNTNFVNNVSAATFSGTGITVNSTTVQSSTQCTANITISSDASADARDITVITGSEIAAGIGLFMINVAAPSISTVAPEAGPAGTAPWTTYVNITGTNFGSSQGTSKVYFGTTDAGTSEIWTATRIVIAVPASLSVGVSNVKVTVSGQDSNTSAFTVVTGQMIDNAESAAMYDYYDSGANGDEANIPVPARTTEAYFDGQKALKIQYPGATEDPFQWGGYLAAGIKSPATNLDISSANMLVYRVKGDGTANTIRLDLAEYTVTAGDTTESFSSLDKFLLSDNSSFKEFKVPFSRVWRDKYSKFKGNNTFSGLISGYTFVYGGTMSTAQYHYVDAVSAVSWSGPIVDIIGPNFGQTGAVITLEGSGFGSTGTITFNGTSATPTFWSNTRIVVPVPAGATSGSVVVTVSSQASNGVYFDVTSSTGAVITGLSSYLGPSGTVVTIEGSGFGSDPGAINRSTAAEHVTFGTTPVATSDVVSWGSTRIVVKVPTMANGTYEVQVRANNKESGLKSFRVAPLPASILSVSPSVGYQGDVSLSLVVTGGNTNFVNGTSVAIFSGTGITVNSTSVQSATQCTVNITISNDATATARDITVTTGGEIATGAGLFTINSPSFASITPNSGAQGTTLTGVVIVGTGTHFINGRTGVLFPVGGHFGITNVQVTDATHLTCDIIIGASAATGAMDITVVTDNNSFIEEVGGANVFTVTKSDEDNRIYEKAGGIMMAYPNPFNPADKASPLKMLFNAATGEAVNIYIFDANGRIIYQHRDVALEANRIAQWDGETSYGEVVDNGLYLIRVVKDGKLVAKGKILVIKK